MKQQRPTLPERLWDLAIAVIAVAVSLTVAWGLLRPLIPILAVTVTVFLILRWWFGRERY